MTTDNTDRRDALYQRAHDAIRRDAIGFAKSYRKLCTIVPEQLIHERIGDQAASPEQMKFWRADFARAAATVQDRDPRNMAGCVGWFDYRANAPRSDRLLAARMTVLAIWIAADPEAHIDDGGVPFDFPTIGWFDGPTGLIGQKLIDWKEPGWTDGSSPSCRVLDILEGALDYLYRYAPSAGRAWEWNQDGTLNYYPAALTLSTVIDSVIEQANLVLSIVESSDRKSDGSRSTAEQRSMLDTALRKMFSVAGLSHRFLYVEERSEDKGNGIRTAVFAPKYDIRELAIALQQLSMTPFGPVGYDQLKTISEMQINGFRQKIALVSKLADTLPRSDPPAASGGIGSGGEGDSKSHPAESESKKEKAAVADIVLTEQASAVLDFLRQQPTARPRTYIVTNLPADRRSVTKAVQLLKQHDLVTDMGKNAGVGISDRGREWLRSAQSTA